MTRWRASVAIGSCLAFSVSAGALALAAETTPDEYREAVEPICRANSAANHLPAWSERQTEPDLSFPDDRPRGRSGPRGAAAFFAAEEAIPR